MIIYILLVNPTYIFDLEKNIINNIGIESGFIGDAIQWNNQYIIFIDEKGKAVKIIDLTIKRIISVMKLIGSFENIKKINDPIYGESLLICG